MSHQPWFVRRNNKVVGPFPHAQIQEYLDKGKLLRVDEISRDRETWMTVEASGQFSAEISDSQTMLLHPWFVRRGSKVVGPFPHAQIKEYLNNGKLLRNDEISYDRTSWTNIEESGHFPVEVKTPKKTATHQRWYVKSHGKVIGPFPNAQIEEYLLLGRLDRSNEISLDRENWVTIQMSGQFPEQVAPAVEGDETWNAERLKAKHRWLDERLYAEDEVPSDVRGTEPNSVLALRHDHMVTKAMQQAERGQKPKIWLGILIIMVVCAIAFGIWQGQGEGLVIDSQFTAPDCAAVRPGANWSGCEKRAASLQGSKLKQSNMIATKLDEADLRSADMSFTNLTRASLRAANLEGALLRAADFTGADLTGANLGATDLSYATFTGAKMDGVRLEGALLSKASWVDGRICAEGSVGSCR